MKTKQAKRTDYMVATGYDFEPLNDGSYLLEFYGPDGKTFSHAIVTDDFLTTVHEVVRAVLRHRGQGGSPAAAIAKLLIRREATTFTKVVEASALCPACTRKGNENERHHA